LLVSDFGAGVACFFATLLGMVALRPVAVAIELVDKPGGRKTHRGDIPVVGGIAMFVGMVFGLGLLPANLLISTSLLSAAALLVIVGLLDDRFEISPIARLAAHLVAAILVVSTASDLAIQSLGRPFGGQEVTFSSLGSIGFTCVAIVGAINAFNMLDGMDGLAGTMAVIALIALAYLATDIGEGGVASIALVCCGAVTAFLVFNIPARFNRRFRCFMGDAGSTLLGFVLACVCISVSQGGLGPRVQPTAMLWLVAIPLYELLWTFMRRLLRGHSPFRPDRAHFHHKLLDAGFGVRGAFFVLVITGGCLALTGVIIHVLGIPDSVSFALWLTAGLGMVLLMQHASVLWYVLPLRLRRTRPLPEEAAS
jgi:UDP-GlcNAc:undecaprenyl-phosphate GlcNAc-1-phosphate transferase